MITLIDYGGSNIRSVQNALRFLGVEAELTDEPEKVLGASKLILPGVGAFGAGMAGLRQRGLITPIHVAVENGTPLLGICLGMQFLFEQSNELGTHTGLGLIAGHVTRFAAGAHKVPHMGWNQLEHSGTHPFLQGVPHGSHAYFVHSYYCVPQDPSVVIAHTVYGRSFPAMVQYQNVYGIQFHPEKSQKIGLQLLQNFANL